MKLITDTYDLVCLVLSVASLPLIVIQLYLHDWSIEKLLFDEEEEK